MRQLFSILLTRAGVLDDVDAIFALHNWPALPAGIVASRSGTIMAGTAEYRITMHGRGGHAAMPHQNIDPIPAVASLVSALQVRAHPPCCRTYDSCGALAVVSSTDKT